LIVFYDEERFAMWRRSPQECFVAWRAGWCNCRRTQRRRYMFRVDLRFAPGPRRPRRLSLLAAETYYESFAELGAGGDDQGPQVAGDPPPGPASPISSSVSSGAVISISPPFRHHSIKRQIDAHRGGGKIAIPATMSSWARRHSRDRILRADAATDLGRRSRNCGQATLDGLAGWPRPAMFSAETVAELSDAYRPCAAGTPAAR